jgi:hypothetical protein
MRENAGMKSGEDFSVPRETNNLGPWSLCVAPMMDWTEN